MALTLGIDEGTLWRLERDAYEVVDPRIREVVKKLRIQFRIAHLEND